MFLYHSAFPLQYIVIPCFFYGILATLFTKSFKNKKIVGQILLTILIIILTILISSPFGGMLWHFHDMKAGYFPEKWISKMITRGFTWGLETGWYIILLSIPYNIFGSILCFLLTKKGVTIYSEKSK